MKKIIITVCIAILATAAAIAEHHEGTVVPAKISKSDISGTIFERPDMLESKHDDGHVTLDVTTLLSSDKKFASGMYRSGKTRSEIKEPYGVDEFRRYVDVGGWLCAGYQRRRRRNDSEGMDRDLGYRRLY